MKAIKVLNIELLRKVVESSIDFLQYLEPTSSGKRGRPRKTTMMFEKQFNVSDVPITSTPKSTGRGKYSVEAPKEGKAKGKRAYSFRTTKYTCFSNS